MPHCNILSINYDKRFLSDLLGGRVCQLVDLLKEVLVYRRVIMLGLFLSGLRFKILFRLSPFEVLKSASDAL